MLVRSHHSYVVSALCTVVLAVCFICGCSHSIDPRLKLAESIMEEHPDSALIILTDIDASKFSHSEDIALYGLLLTHARYKNFIDETNDSIISASAEYFLKQDDKERSARALFLKGMIQMNADHFGEAAVSLTQAVDIARECRQYFWEGQSARGLFILYGKLKNGSQQKKYAKTEYEAFSKGNIKDWLNFATLDILRGYNNNGEYDIALSGANRLLETAEEANDPGLMAEVLTLIGTCQYSLCDYRHSVESYLAAFKLDSIILTENHKFNVSVALSEIDIDSFANDDRKMVDDIVNGRRKLYDFNSMADHGDYEKAYESLVYYKNMQDSVLKTIMQNNVSESVGQYESMKDSMAMARIKYERLKWILGLVVVSMLCVFSIWMYRKRLYVKDLERMHMEETMESLRSDLSEQIAKMDHVLESNRIAEERNTQMTSYLRDLLQDKYSEINNLCDSYFQDRFIPSRKKGLAKEIEKVVGNFTDEKFLKDVGMHIDRCYDGLYSSFLNDFPNVKNDVKLLFIFQVLAFSNRTICVIFDIEANVLYNRKARLKRMIAEIVVDRKEDYMKILMR